MGKLKLTFALNSIMICSVLGCLVMCTEIGNYYYTHYWLLRSSDVKYDSCYLYMEDNRKAAIFRIDGMEYKATSIFDYKNSIIDDSVKVIVVYDVKSPEKNYLDLSVDGSKARSLLFDFLPVFFAFGILVPMLIKIVLKSFN